MLIPQSISQPLETSGKQLLLFKFLEFLHLNHIDYCLLGNTDNYPETISSDVDVVIAEAALPSMIQKLVAAENEWPWQVVQCIQHEKTAYYLVLALKDTELTATFLHPDLCSDYMRQGRLLLDSHELLKDRQYTKKSVNYYVPAPAQAFAYYLLKRIGKQDFSGIHGNYLHEQYLHNPEGSLKQLQRFWESDNARLLEESAKNNQWKDVKERFADLQQELNRSAPRGLTSVFGELARAIKRWRQPTGFWVAFLGPDGCGKSAVIEAVNHQLAPAFRRTQIFHLRPTVQVKPGSPTQPVTDPHGQAPRSLLMSLAKLLYLGAEYLFGYWFKIRFSMVRSTLVLFDRYLIDMAVDPGRFRYKGSIGAVRWLAANVPQPDLYILLEAPTEVLQSRKQEVSFDEAERQQREYATWASTCKNCVRVDASQALEDVVAQVNHTILSAMVERVRQRFHV